MHKQKSKNKKTEGPEFFDIGSPQPRDPSATSYSVPEVFEMSPNIEESPSKKPNVAPRKFDFHGTQHKRVEPLLNHTKRSRMEKKGRDSGSNAGSEEDSEGKKKRRRKRVRKRGLSPDGGGGPDIPNGDPGGDPGPPGIPIPVNGPWKGDMAGVTWNANGLTKTDTQNKMDKCNELINLMKGNQIGVVTETHGSSIRSDPYAQKLSCMGYRTYWSHEDEEEPHGRASKGVMVALSKAFAAKFAQITRTEIIKGHVIKVRCMTQSGLTLDIFGCYFPANSRTSRRNTMETIRQNMENKAHNLVMGDFNFTEKGGDRFNFCRDEHGWQTTGDPESVKWHEQFDGDHKLNEIFQPRMTYHCNVRTSRIDRVYTSLKLPELACFNGKAWVVDNSKLSDHKPVKWEMKMDSRGQGSSNPFALWTFKSTRYPQ